MKLISKPVKKVTTEDQGRRSKMTAVTTALLSGVIAITATGCTAEVKLADGTPVGNIVINESAIPSGITVNQQNVNADPMANPDIELPDDNSIRYLHLRIQSPKRQNPKLQRLQQLPHLRQLLLRQLLQPSPQQHLQPPHLQQLLLLPQQHLLKLNPSVHSRSSRTTEYMALR